MKALFGFWLLCGLHAAAQRDDEQQIRQLLTVQMNTWNRGNIDSFMQTYWHSDSLVFIGSKGVVHGWQQTLDRYKKSYPDRQAMGVLTFEILELRRLSPDYYFLTGTWKLQRQHDAPGGYSTLLLRRIGGVWKIVADHSS